MEYITKAIITLVFITSNFAQAATVDSDSAVSFLFDFSALDSINLHQFTYNAEIDLPDNPDIGLESNRSFRLDFGTSQGDDSVASFVFTNPFAFSITGVGSVFSGSVIIPGDISSLFVSANYVDDVFDIGSFELIYFDKDMNAVFQQGQLITTVPLPASIVFLASGMVSLRFYAKTKLTRS